MAFERVKTLETDNTIGLGGKNKSTQKLNPTQIEGYFLGTRKVDSTKDKRGFSYIHVFQTSKGNVGVWGKTNMDRQLEVVQPGTMTRVTATGKTRPTKNGDMILFNVEVDTGNTIEVEGLSAQESTDDGTEEGDGTADYGTEDQGADDDSNQEAPEAIPASARAPSNAAQQARVASLLGKKK